MQRQTEEGAGYERRLEAVHLELNTLRKQIQAKEDYIQQQAVEVE